MFIVQLVRILVPLVLHWQRFVAQAPFDKYIDAVNEWAPNLELLDRNTHILYPVLGMLTIGLLVMGLLAALRQDDVTGMAKIEAKRTIITRLRKELNGVTIPEMAAELRLKNSQTAKIVEEMHNEGIIDPATDEKKRAVWRIRLR